MSVSNTAADALKQKRKLSMRKIISSSAIAALAVMAIGTGMTSVAHADGEMGYVGARSPVTPACPAFEWRVLPVPPGGGKITGVAYFSDMSGISTIKGTIGADGKITATVTSIEGKGPAGPVTGQREKNTTRVEVHGTGCSNVALNLTRWVPGAPASGDGSSG